MSFGGAGVPPSSPSSCCSPRRGRCGGSSGGSGPATSSSRWAPGCRWSGTAWRPSGVPPGPEIGWVEKVWPSPGTAAPMDVIRFYSVSDDFGQFSNFAPFPIRLDGERWPTSEHYFQAQKFEDEAYRQAIRQAKSPAEAARLGRDRKRKLRRDWESVKVGVMRRAVLAKFTQHEDLRALLLSTGEAEIVEYTENDSYWGDGGDGGGKNVLGRILMEVREQLRAGRTAPSSGGGP